MFKVMIVDDEPLVRKGIATSIDWEEHGIQIVQEAANGTEALAKLENEPVDLVLTDIRMPVMSGLDLSRHLKERYPDIAVVLLSGYEDFAYARAAIQIGIHNYLLKPASASELISVVTEVKQRKEKELDERRSEINRNLILNANLPYLKWKFLDSLMKEEIDDDGIADKLKTLRIDLRGSEYAIFIIDIYNFAYFTDGLSQKGKEAFTYAVFNIAEEILLSYYSGFVCYGENDKIVALFAANKSHSVMDVCEEIQSKIRRYLKLSVTIGIGKPCASLHQIGSSFKEANLALREKAFKGSGKIYLYTDRVPTVSPKADYLLVSTADEKTAVHNVKLLTAEEFRERIDQYLKKLTAQHYSFEGVKRACVRLTILIAQQLEDLGLSAVDAFETESPHVLIERFEVLEDLKAWLFHIAENVASCIATEREKSSKRIVKEALKFIEERYDQDIGLGDVADHAHVTPTYLSKLFREEMGIPFVKWLNQFRIEKAKTLLQTTHLKTYEIAEAVGYLDYKYFSNTFRKYTGVSPREYRNR